MGVELKLPWTLLTDQSPGCAQCEKEGGRGEIILNADGETMLSSGHETYYMPEFDLETIVAAVNAMGQSGIPK